MTIPYKKVVNVIPLPVLRPQKTESHLKRSIGQNNGKSTLREEEFSWSSMSWWEKHYNICYHS